MRLGRLVSSAVIFVPLLLVCAGRLHAQRGGSPQGMTQEVNRCLTVMRVAAARRRTNEDERQREQLSVAVRSDSSPAFGHRQLSAKSA